MPVANSKIFVKCAQCGVEVKKRRDRISEKMFCSRACQQENSKTKVKVKCTQCKATVEKKPSEFKRTKNFFCSKECFDKFQKKSITVKCIEKKKEMVRPPSQTKGGKLFCSIKCRTESNIKKTSKKCYQCEKEFPIWPWHIRERNFCSVECRRIGHSKIMSGEKSVMWKGGWKSYYGENWNRQSREARKRDNYTCQHCGLKESDHYRALDVHHKKPFSDFCYIPGENDNYKKANVLSNLITLCPSCHGKADRK